MKRSARQYAQNSDSTATSINDSASSGSLIGFLNRKITLLSRVETDDTGGGETTVWEKSEPIWAAITPSIGRQMLFADQRMDKIPYIIKIRYRHGVVPSMRIQYKTRIFEIKTIMDIQEAHNTIEIIATELDAQGVV